MLNLSAEEMRSAFGADGRKQKSASAKNIAGIRAVKINHSFTDYTDFFEPLPKGTACAGRFPFYFLKIFLREPS